MTELLDVERMASADPLVAARLMPPRSTSTIVSRPRLLQSMETAARSPITIVSGEAAAGKTSVVVDWIDSMARDRPVAWMTLPRGLGDPILFWRYFLAAIESLGIDCDDLALALGDKELPDERWLSTLANRLADVPSEPLIVLDDLHELDTAEGWQTLLAFLERTPATLHAFLLTRSKPPWHLDRWKVSGRLAEIASVDLRFTLEEARQIVDVAEVELSDADIVRLVERTEGWAGGLRLALLSMRHVVDPGAFVARFAGDDELVSSYLLREVLEQQPQEIREFLLDISILEYITPEVCDALRDRNDGAELLARCRAESLFLTEFGTLGAYRMHTMFAHLLRATLDLNDPARLVFLRRQASAMFEDLGDIQSSIAHAVDAGDQARIGELVAAHSGEYARRGQFDEIRSWISLLRFGEAYLAPEVGLGLAMTLSICGMAGDALEQLDHLAARTISPRVEYAATQVRGVAMMVDGRLDDLADIATALSAAVPAGDTTLPFEPLRMASYYAGITAFLDDDHPAARGAFEHAAEPRANPDLTYVESPGWLARLAHAGGDLTAAERWGRKALIRNEELGGAETAVLTPAYLALAEVAWERDHLDDADLMVVKAQRSIRPLLWEAILVQAVASRVLASRGLLDDARRQLVECGQTYLRGDRSRSLRAVLSERAIDLALMAGDVDDAHGWERSHAADVDRPLSISLQLRLAAPVGVVDVRSMVDEAVQAKQTIPRRIDTLLAGAALVGRIGERGRCIELVSVATHLAEPNWLTRRFLDAGAEVHDALRSIAATPSAVGAAPLASRYFLESLTSTLTAPTGAAPRSAPSNGALVEPLTRRELQVLDLLVAGQTYADIGAQLYVSRNTVKSHASHIYTKLGVSGRSAATDVARRLNLV